MTQATRALRGRILTFRGDPHIDGAHARIYIADGLVVVINGLIDVVGEASQLLRDLPDHIPVEDHRPHLITAGFIDPHLHFPQTRVIASYGAQLMEWLEKYTFVEEQKYGNPAFAETAARFFFDELLRNGTTTAAAYCSVHPQSADACFAEARRRNMRMIGGKSMMDRNAPPVLRDTAQQGYDESSALIARWHGEGRCLYAITPRFAITSTPAQLEAAQALVNENPDCYIQTHLSENLREIETTRELFPWARDYTHVYEHYGLLGRLSLFGHCIHLSDDERARLSQTESVLVHCPTSNLFLGSGLFDLAAADSTPLPSRVAVATDIGGGTSYSMLATMAEAYKIQQLQGMSLTASRAFYMMTLGNARALSLETSIGSLAPGMEADMIVLNSRATPAMEHRMETAATLDEELFILMMMGDDRAIAQTYVMGALASIRA